MISRNFSCTAKLWIPCYTLSSSSSLLSSPQPPPPPSPKANRPEFGSEPRPELGSSRSELPSSDHRPELGSFALDGPPDATCQSDEALEVLIGFGLGGRLLPRPPSFSFRESRRSDRQFPSAGLFGSDPAALRLLPFRSWSLRLPDIGLRPADPGSPLVSDPRRFVLTRAGRAGRPPPREHTRMACEGQIAVADAHDGIRLQDTENC